MKEEFNIIEKTGAILFILLMIPFVLVLVAEPSVNESDLQLPSWIAWGWLGVMSFSVFLIIVGNIINKFNK